MRKILLPTPVVRLVNLNQDTWSITDPGDGDVQASEDDQQQLGPRQDCEPGHGCPQGERARVPQDDPGRRCVPPQEPEAGAGEGGCDGGQVQRGCHLVAQAGRLAGGSARVIVLPDADDGVGAEHHRCAACEQPVESVDEVRGVAGPVHHEPDEKHDDHPRQGRAEVAHEGQLVRDRLPPRRLPDRDGSARNTEREADDGLPQQLGLAPETEAALPS